MTEVPDGGELPRIAVFSGPTATIQNTPPLVTTDGSGGCRDTLRAQRLAAPAVVYVEQFSAHPLEADSGDLYAPPDGYLTPDGELLPPDAAPGPGCKPVLRVELRPGDGPFLLPYTARTRSGAPWLGSGLTDGAPEADQRQTFFPDASRLYEEIDRFGVDSQGYGRSLSTRARFGFFRAIPSGGYRKGLPADLRTDTAGDGGPGAVAGDLPPEQRGADYFGYFPRHLRTEPDMASLARATNLIQEVLGSGQFAGGQWLEGSPTTEESMYWFNLLLDVTVPLVGHSAQRPHGSLSADGDRNIVDGVRYLASRAWADPEGRDAVGTVMIVDEVVYASRQVAKTDARPGNYVATGGFGGIVGSIEGSGAPVVTYLPNLRHTWCSDLRLTQLPSAVPGLSRPDVTIRDGAGALVPAAMPAVTIVSYGRYADGGCNAAQVAAWLAHARERHPLAGVVAEGANPYGAVEPGADDALRAAALSGVPVVKCGRGNTAGFTPRQEPWAVSGNNLTATKARILLLAALLKFGALPAAADPDHPRPDELERTYAAVAGYQRVFDNH